jgi:hypothetical protein
VADTDSTYLAENPDSNLKEVERQISFDAAASVGRAKSATKAESGTAEINPQATGCGLV